jgi:integrase
LVKESSTDRLSKSWAQRLRIAGKPINIGLGSFPVLTLARAREKALANARMVAEGGDPRIPPIVVPTFAQALDQVITEQAQGWKNAKTAKRWRATLETYASPVIGDMLVSEIDSSHIKKVLLPIWTDKVETAKKVRERVGLVMKWAIAERFRPDNPAGPEIIKVLPKQPQQERHYRALPFQEVGSAIATIRNTNAWWATKACLEFTTLTAVRSGEARLAKWDEIDQSAGVWTIPAERMKRNLEHKVPLNYVTMDLLRDIRNSQFPDWDHEEASGLVFPSPTGKALTDSTMSKLLRDNGIGCVPHGMRSSFRDWAAEISDFERDVAEHALHHIDSSATERSYKRTDYFDKRRLMMGDWAQYVMETGNLLDEMDEMGEMDGVSIGVRLLRRLQQHAIV